MKHLKTFERHISNDIPKNTKFKIGDYVIVDSIDYTDESKIVYKVIGYSKNKYGSLYRVEELNNTKNDNYIYWQPKNLRKATPEEVIEFELRQSINKYNL